MPANLSNSAKSWWGIIFTHNPFYVISAVLTLYGLHLSFGENIDPTRGWLQLQLFVGYMLLLSATGVLVVRLGEVWEDARTLFLLVLLLMVALSVSFDRVCLDDQYVGLMFLSVSLAFCLLVCETLLRVLKIRLPWYYRSVFYLQLVMLFLYPPWLGHLSLTDQLSALGWYAMGFPTFMAATVVMLLPAARRRMAGLRRNGTPWRWPWYPWTIFLVLGIGVLIRALTITYSFDPTKGFRSGFQGYFLIPLLLAVLLIMAENCIGRSSQRPWWRFIVLPLSTLALALPGTPHSKAQARYLDLLQETIGSPIQIAAVLLIAYFVYLLCKGVKTAEWGILVSLGVLSFVDHDTVNLRTLTGMNPIPMVIGVSLMLATAVLWRNTARMCVATLGVVALLTYALRETGFVANRGYVPIHLAVVAVILVGAIYRDHLGRAIRRYAAVILAAVALLSILTYRHLFPDIAAPWHALGGIVLGAVAALGWQKDRQLRDLLAILLCFSASTLHLAEHYLGAGLNFFLLRGKRWIAWGALFFLAGLMVSLAKGRQFQRFYQTLQDWDSALRNPTDRT